MSRRFHKWLIGFFGTVLVLALMPLNDRLIKTYPSALWVEVGAMAVVIFIGAYRNELRNRE